MAVYVDDAAIPATVPNGQVRHTSQWSHLFADTQEELHEFAARLGLRRSYFQPGKPRGDGSPSPHWHYDVTAGKRQQALRLGAQPVTWRDAPRIMRERDAAAERAQVADQASRAAGLAYRAGEFVRAGRLLDAARQADPARSELWAERTAQVHAAARAAAAAAVPASDPRPLAEIVSARLAAAGVPADDMGLQFIRAWNAERLAAAGIQPELEAGR
jgi:hypothetical protein